MSKPAAPVKLASLANLPTVTLVLTYHFAAESAARQAAGYAALCGLTLKALKKEVGHGKWLGYYAEHLVKALPDRTARHYLQVAEGLRVKAKDHPALLALLRLPAHRLPAAKREHLAKMVRGITDKETMASLIEAYRITKRPVGAAATGGYRPDEGKVQAFLAAEQPALAGTPYADTPPETQAAFRQWVAQPGAGQETQLALDLWAPVIRHFDEDTPRRSWMHLPRPEQERLRAALSRTVADLDAALGR